MAQEFTVSLNRIIKEHNLEALFLPANVDEREINSSEVNRPGLEMVGFYEYFDNRRIQIIGRSEGAFLDALNDDDFNITADRFFASEPSAVIVARNLQIAERFVPFATKYNVPLLRTADSTSSFMATLIAFLNLQLAPRITRHGVLVEVYGEGILLLGESGVGKSETAIELVKRGHRLIADDAVEIRRVSSNLEPWDVNKVYDRMGLDKETTDILGLQIPSLTIPVKPGRNLAVIIEVAAMNNRQKKLGYNAAEDLLVRLGMTTDGELGVEKKVQIF